MPTLKWTSPAIDDLWSIDAWLMEEASGEVALTTLATIRFRAGFLQDFPRGGRPIGEGIRLLRVINTPHLIFYRLVDDTIEILRVMHEREDWQVQF